MVSLCIKKQKVEANHVGNETCKRLSLFKGATKGPNGPWIGSKESAVNDRKILNGPHRTAQEKGARKILGNDNEGN